MTGILRPDGSEGSFKYDPLGRRIEKRASEQTTKFVWDGNNPIHEWVENGETESDKRNDLVTWIFDDGFVPTAKLTKDGNYSIISDYIGTPVEAYDLSGKKVWEQELDIYGRVKRSAKPSWEQTAEAALFDEYFIPFRYQGQYDDIETGLYYNRFRYYDPDVGQYTKPDPIGLEGGNPTLYSYISNPNWWVDPLGLERRVGSNTNSGTPRTLTGRAANHLIPNPTAIGAHTTLRIDPVTGRITHYQTWTPNPMNPTGFDSVIRVDLVGRADFNKVTGVIVQTPHVHGRLIPGRVRPAFPWEIPR